jgi:hypothetical protein
MTNPAKTLHDLSLYFEGMSDALKNEKMKDASKWLEKASRNICGQGYFGCFGGEKCSSDHK